MLLGFSIAAPVGPIGVLCIRRTLGEGLLHGLFTGLGAATADCFYGLVAGMGLTALSSALLSHESAIRLTWSLFLFYLGVRTIRARVETKAAGECRSTLAGAYVSSLFLTVTNPATIVSFLAIFAGLGVGGGASVLSLVAGVFIGSAFWWLLLSGGVSFVRGWITAERLVWVNRLSGTIILAFAASFLAKSVG